MLKWLFEDKQGRVVLWQKPNAPLWVWLVSAALTRILPNGTLHDVFELIAFGSLFTWAWMEWFNGASPIRRALGVVVLVVLINSKL